VSRDSRSPDSLERAIRRRRLLAGSGLMLTVSVAVWAFSPVSSSVRLDLRPVVATAQHTRPERGRLDRAPFSRRIWNAATPEATVAGPSRQSTTGDFRFKLVGITSDEGVLRAALYDPQTDRLLIVGHGDRLGSSEVTLIEAKVVELTAGSRSRRLSLERRRP